MFTNPFSSYAPSSIAPPSSPASASSSSSSASLLATSASSVLHPLPANSTFPLPSGMRRSSLAKVVSRAEAPGSTHGDVLPLAGQGGAAAVPWHSASSGSGTSSSSSDSGSSNTGPATIFSSAGGITFVSPFAAAAKHAGGASGPSDVPASAPQPPSLSVAGSSAHATGAAQAPAARERVSISVATRKASIISTSSSTRSRSRSRAASHDFSSNPLGSPGSRRASLQSTPSPLRSPAIQSAHAQPFFSHFNDSNSNTPGGASTTSSLLAGRHHIDFMRRRSVDVGVLGVGTHHQGTGAASRRVREAVGPDAGDKEFGLIGAGAKGGKDRLLGRHLASLLAHSLSLCSEPPQSSVVDLPPMLPKVEGQPLRTLPVIPASPTSSPNASRNTSVSTGSVSFSVVASSSPGEAADVAASAPVPPLRPAAPASAFPVLSEAKRSKLIANLQSWSFNAMSYTSDELLSCVGLIFEGVRSMEGVEFDLAQFKSLLLLLRSAYHSRNGYHNFSHATDVTQACYSFLIRMGLAPPLYLLAEDDYDPNLGEGRRKWRRNRAVEESGMGELLRPMDVFALMVAAIGHDVGHPGLSNAYMVNARTPVAQVYEDKSVLENFHTVTLIHMLRRYNFDHLLGGDFGRLGEKATDFRKVLEASILATDMSRHFTFVNEINDMGRRFGERRGSSSGTIEADRLLLCSGLIKCADISNPTRPHRISRAWSTALLEEWSIQAAIEAQFGLPVSVMTIDVTDTKAQAKSQVGFIDLFAKPLFTAMAGVVDEFADFAEKLQDGRTAWEAISLQTDEAFRQPIVRDFKLSPPPSGRSHSRSSSNRAEGEEESPTTPRMSQEAVARDATSKTPSSSTTPQPTTLSASLMTLRADQSAPSRARPPSPTMGRPTPNRHNYDQRHHRHYSGGSSSTNASPLSPLFPGSVSSIATGTSLTASTPSDNVSLFSVARAAPPTQLAADLSVPLKASCGGACTTATAMCEICAQKVNPARRGSLGQALLGIERRQAEEQELAEFDEIEGELNGADPLVWPPYPFM